MLNYKMVKITEDKPKGWDIADAIYEEGMGVSQIQQFIEDNAVSINADLLLPQLFDTKSGKPNLSHSTMAELMKCLYVNILRYNSHSGKWHLFNGKYLQPDEVGQVFDFAKKTCEFVYKRAFDLLNDGGSQDLLQVAKYAINSKNARNLESIIKLASKEKGIRMQQQDFDRNGNLFNLQNGTYDLEGDSFREHCIDDNLTKIVGYNYDKGARCPFWKKTLRIIFNDDKKKIEYLQRFIGYSLTASTDQQCFLFFYGRGKNGKSTITSALEMLFGDYACKSPAEMLMHQKGSRISNDVARLAGMRLVICDEVQEGARLDEARVKNLTGGDTITARFLYRELFTFKPSHKIIMFGNHHPDIKGTDDGIWRRVILVPFNVEIPEEIRLPMSEVLEKLREELPGIFNWALEGYRKYKESGLKKPKSIKDAISRYREDSDAIKQYLRDCCIVSSSLKIKCMDLYSDFERWCKQNNEEVINARKFSERMKERGFINKPGSGNRHYWKGIDLK